jgi:plastocyanin
MMKSTAVVLWVLLMLTAPAFAEESSQTVMIEGFSFKPATLTIAVGTQVMWMNHDQDPHTVVSSDKTFRSKALDTNESFSYTFDKAGSYPYFCSMHPSMTGTVIVQPAKQ